MAQAGIYGLVGVAVRRWMPKRNWLLLGIVLGNLLPDADNLAVAVATVTGGSTEGLHRTFTHSLFFVLALLVLFWLAGVVMKRPSIGNLGLGLGIGVLLHVPLGMLRLMAWLIRPFHPGLSQVMRTSIWQDTTDQTFDPRPTLQKYPIPLTKMEDWVTTQVAGEQPPLAAVAD